MPWCFCALPSCYAKKETPEFILYLQQQQQQQRSTLQLFNKALLTLNVNICRARWEKEAITQVVPSHWAAPHLETLSYGDILHSLKQLHCGRIQYELHWGNMTRGCISEQIKSKDHNFSAPCLEVHTHTNWTTHTICIHSLSFCCVVEGAVTHKRKIHFILYSTQICNFKPLTKDKALIGTLCNVKTTLLFLIQNHSFSAIKHLIYTTGYFVFIKTQCNRVKT